MERREGWKRRLWKEVALSHRYYCTIIFLEGLRRTRHKLTQDIRHPGRLPNPRLKTISSGKK
jgi:hypothetical protein